MDRKKNTVENNILVRFTTTHDEYRVSDNPFSLPATLGRVGISDVINHLLELNESSIPFDFLIHGRLLRSPLNRFVSHYQISTEDILLIEYFPAVTASEDTNTQEGDSWIGRINILNEQVGFAACYDGNVLIFDPTTLSVQANLRCHEEPIKALTIWENNDHIHFATGSKDHSIKIWQYDPENHTNHSIYTLKGHVNSIESLNQISLPNSHEDIVLSGDWSGNLLGWKISGVYNRNEEEDHQVQSKKKRKVNEKHAEAIKDIKPFFTQKAHTQSITSIFSTSSFSSVFTSSWDHSFKQWDLDKLDSILTINCSKVITSLDVNPSDRIATSHPDGRIRIWDVKSKDSANVPALSFGKTNNWIAEVKWMPGSEHILASVDYSGVVNVWDLRTSVPLANLEVHDGKGLSLAWSSLNEENKRSVKNAIDRQTYQQ